MQAKKERRAAKNVERAKKIMQKLERSAAKNRKKIMQKLERCAARNLQMLQYLISESDWPSFREIYMDSFKKKEIYKCVFGLYYPR